MNVLATNWMLAFFLFSMKSAYSAKNDESVISVMKCLEKKFLSLEVKVDDLLKRGAKRESKIDNIDKRIEKIVLNENQLSKRSDGLERKLDLNTKFTDVILKRSGLYEYLFVTKGQSWYNAEAECLKWGGHLVTILSKNEHDYFHNEVKERGYEYLIWIGLTDEKKEGKWEWISGMNNFYMNWESTQPQGGRTENCAVIHLGERGGLWHDLSCEYKEPVPFICERKKPLVSS